MSNLRDRGGQLAVTTIVQATSDVLFSKRTVGQVLRISSYVKKHAKDKPDRSSQASSDSRPKRTSRDSIASRPGLAVIPELPERPTERPLTGDQFL